MRILEYFLLYLMLSMILQIGGLWNIIGGITTAAASHHFDEEHRNGKFDFWYL